jgi:succinyl-diaminopimelate desuccinylase
LFFVAYKSEAIPKLAYISQLETIEHGPASVWKDTGFNPLHPTLREKRLYGLGATTGKADFAAKLKALSECKQPGAVAIGCLTQQISKSEIDFLWRRLGAVPTHVLMGAASDLHRIDWSTRELVLIAKIPRPEAEKDWVLNHASEENTISQTRFFSGSEWLSRMKSFLTTLPAQTGVLKIETTCNEFGYAIDGEIEIDSARDFSPSSLERVQAIIKVITQLEDELISNGETRSGLALGKVSSDNESVQIEIVVQATQNIKKSALRNHLDTLQKYSEEWGGKITLKDYTPMFQFTAHEKFIETIDGLVPGVRTERFQFRQSGFDGLDVVAVGPGLHDFAQSVESVPFDQVERATEIYKTVGERILQ